MTREADNIRKNNDVLMRQVADSSRLRELLPELEVWHAALVGPYTIAEPGHPQHLGDDASLAGFVSLNSPTENWVAFAYSVHGKTDVNNIPLSGHEARMRAQAAFMAQSWSIVREMLITLVQFDDMIRVQNERIEHLLPQIDQLQHELIPIKRDYSVLKQLINSLLLTLMPISSKINDEFPEEADLLATQLRLAQLVVYAIGRNGDVDNTVPTDD